MKKVLMVVLLLTFIAFTLISGTLAYYTISIDNLASGSIVAKNFVFVEDGEDSFGDNVKIAPGESVTWQFSVTNYDENTKRISETDMDLEFTLVLSGADGKQKIIPLQLTVTDGNDNPVIVRDLEGNQLDPITGNVTQAIFTDTLPLSTEKQTKTYNIKIDWPFNGQNDTQYAGAGGTYLKVIATAKQAEPQS